MVILQTARVFAQTAKAFAQTAKAILYAAKGILQAAKAFAQIAKAILYNAKGILQTAKAFTQTAKARLHFAGAIGQVAARVVKLQWLDFGQVYNLKMKSPQIVDLRAFLWFDNFGCHVLLFINYSLPGSFLVRIWKAIARIMFPL